MIWVLLGGENVHPLGNIKKRDFCMCENKGADQLRSNCEANQRLCFRYTDSSISHRSSQIQDFKFLACFCDCTGRFVSDQVGNVEDRFSCVTAHMIEMEYPAISESVLSARCTSLRWRGPWFEPHWCQVVFSFEQDRVTSLGTGWWLLPIMTAKLLTGMLNLITNKSIVRCR